MDTPLRRIDTEKKAAAKKFAARALARLSQDHEATQTSVAEAGAIAPLVEILGVRVLAFHRLPSPSVIFHDIPSPFRFLSIALQSQVAGGWEASKAQEEAAGALYALAELERNRKAITEADGIGKLVNLVMGYPPS